MLQATATGDDGRRQDERDGSPKKPTPPKDPKPEK